MAYDEDQDVEFQTGPGQQEVSVTGKDVTSAYMRGFRNAAKPIDAVSHAQHSTFGGGGFEFIASVTGTGDGITGGTGLVEITIIQNYLPYTQGSTSDLGITVGCSGSGYSGWSGGAGGATYNAITYAFPDWSTTIISGSTFGGILLGDFFLLTGTSDNDSRECCYSCPATGY